MLNNTVIMGRLTRDPELRHTQSGTAVASFTLAVDRDYKAEGAERETDFIDCVAWRNTAEFVSRNFTKGRMVVASGRVQVRKWSDNDGGTRRAVEVVAENVYFGDSRPATASQQTAQNAAPAQQAETQNYDYINEDDGDLPF